MLFGKDIPSADVEAQWFYSSHPTCELVTTLSPRDMHSPENQKMQITN